MQNLTFRVRCKSFLIDFTVAFAFSTIIRFGVSCFFYIPFLSGLVSVFLFYYVFCYTIWNTTVGLSFYEGALVRSDGKKAEWLNVMFRELFTSLPAYTFLGYWIYRFYVFHLHMPEPGLSRFGFFLLYTILPFIMILLTLFQKRIFRLQIGKPLISNSEKNLVMLRKNILIFSTVTLVLAGISRFVHTFQTNSWEHVSKNFIWTVPRPSSHSVKKYTDFLRQHRKNINDYIFGLFQKYDHIILCERAHPELTQYDMIFDIVADKRFIDSVGIVFTEVGNVGTREDFKNFMNKSYPNDADLNKGLSAFLVNNSTTNVIWPRTNWFQFLKKIYYFNLNQHKNSQIRIAFSGIHPPWETLSNQVHSRDSLMADNIISTIRSDSLKKTLTIMNYRHAYLLNADAQDNCGYYLEKAFPNKVANILINSTASNYGNDSLIITPPIRQGKWDVAFEQMPDSTFAFDLKGSPFGNDRFDHFIRTSILSTKKYHDMFTGVIYYLPLYRHILSDGYPYMLDEENKKLILQHANRLGENYYNEVKNQLLPFYMKFGEGRQWDKNRFYYRVNQFENIIFAFFYVLGILVILMLSIIYYESKKKLSKC